MSTPIEPSTGPSDEYRPESAAVLHSFETTIKAPLEHRIPPPSRVSTPKPIPYTIESLAHVVSTIPTERPPSPTAPPSEELAQTPSKKPGLEQSFQDIGRFFKSIKSAFRTGDKIEGRKILAAPRKPEVKFSQGPLGVTASVGTGVGLLFDVVGIFGATAFVANSISAIQTAKEIKKKGWEGLRSPTETDAIRSRAQYQYGKERVRKELHRLGYGVAWLSSSAANILRGIGTLALQVGGVIAPSVSAVLAAVGGVAVAPITFVLSAIGIRRNVNEIRRISAQLIIARQERERVEQAIYHLEGKDGVEGLDPEETVQLEDLKERLDFLNYAIFKLKESRVNHILSIVQHTLIILATTAGVLSLVTGPIGGAFAITSIVLFAIGIGGPLIAKATLAVIDKHKKDKLLQSHRYISGTKLRDRVTHQLLEDQEKQINALKEAPQYDLAKPPSQWSNAELYLAFLSRDAGGKIQKVTDLEGEAEYRFVPKSDEFSAQSVRDKFLYETIDLQEKQIWKTTFGGV